MRHSREADEQGFRQYLKRDSHLPSGRRMPRSRIRERTPWQHQPRLRPLRPTTARRVVLRATPATLIGVPGRPTLACAVSVTSDGPVLFDHSIEPKVPHAKTAAARHACPMLMFFIEASLIVK